MTLNAVADCTLRRLGSALPVSSNAQKMVLSTGVRAIQCADLHIERCLFAFVSTPDVKRQAQWRCRRSPIAAIRLERNRFLHVPQKNPNEQVDQLMVGFGAVPASPGVKPGDVAAPDLVPALLDSAVIVGNEFAGLTLAAFVRAGIRPAALRRQCRPRLRRRFLASRNTDLDLMRQSMIEADL